VTVFEMLRERVDLAEFAERFTELKTSGRALRGCCPFPDHQDDTPSFYIYPDERFHCFGCRRHGDSVDLWAGTQGIEPGMEAALDLAREFGVELPERDPEARQKAQERRQREDGFLEQAKGCYRALACRPQVREWWERRGFGEDLQERFLLGINGDGSAATIPYWKCGRVQCLIERRFRGERKYLLPSGEELPDGHKPLFVPGPVRGPTFLVEGFIDALALAALGESTIAVGGTNISEYQMRELEKISGPLYILPDADEEGTEAVREWVRKLYPKALLCPAEYGREASHAKDFADAFAAEGEAAKERLEELKDRAIDGLELALQGVPEDPSKRRRLKYVRENVIPLILRPLEAEGPKALLEPVKDSEVLAALDDVAAATRVRLAALKDATEKEAQRRLIKTANAAKTDEEPDPGPLPKDTEHLVARYEVLNRYVEDVAYVHGVVKDRDVLRLQTLVAVGAQLAPYPNGKPAGANLIITAEPGRGKNYVCDAVASLLPEGFFLAFESASAKSLFYRAEKNPTLLKHVWIYPNEAEATDQLVEMFRPLLSGGKASHLTVNKDSDGRNAAQELNVEGPASITIPTVRNKLDGQLQTRMLVAELVDYEGRVAAHSRASSKQLLPNYAAKDHGPKVRAWQAALESLTEVRRVVFDLDHEEFCFDSDQVSHGARLWGNLLGLMLAHAWLEQKNREIMELANGERAVVATPEDYEAAYDIFKATCERSIVNLSDTHRKILDAVYELKKDSDFNDGFSQRKIATQADVSVSTVSEHKTFLTKSVKLLYEAEGGGLMLVADAEPSWWTKGDLLIGFPRPDQVWAWWEEIKTSPAPTTTEHAEHPDDEGQYSLTYGEKDVRYSTEHQPNAAEHLFVEADMNGGVRQGTECVRQDPDQKNGLGKPETTPENVVFGMFDRFEDKEPSQTVAEGLQRLLREHPEYRERRPGQIACRLHMGGYTPFVPKDEEVEAAMKEVF